MRLEDIKDPEQRRRFAAAAGITDPAKTGLLPRVEPTPQIPAPLRRPKPRMNGTETEFHSMLLNRGYDKIQFEGITLELASGSSYTPDFYCCTKPTPGCPIFTVVFYETKNNFIRDAALVRLKVAARNFPEFTFVLAQKKKGQWSELRMNP